MINLSATIYSATASRKGLDNVVKTMEGGGFEVAKQIVNLGPHEKTFDPRMKNWEIAQNYRTMATAIVEIGQILTSEQVVEGSQYKGVIERAKTTELRLADYVLQALNNDVEANTINLISLRIGEIPKQTIQYYMKVIEEIFYLNRLIIDRQKQQSRQYDLTSARMVYNYLKTITSRN